MDTQNRPTRQFLRCILQFMRIGTQGQVANGFTFFQWAIFYIIKNVDVSFDKLSVRLCLRRVAEVNILGIAEVLPQTLPSLRTLA